MWVVTAAQMRLIETATLRDYGIPTVLLMENAGFQVAALAWDILTGVPARLGGGPHPLRLRPVLSPVLSPPTGPGTAVAPSAATAPAAQPLAPAGRHPRVVVAVGKGNNGGDALVAARHLHNWGCEVTAVLWAVPDDLPPDAHTNLLAARRMGISIWAAADGDTEGVAELLARADLVIDGLLGTGVRGAPRQPIAGAIDLIVRSGRPVLAIDVPSGVSADSGATEGPAVRARWTVTLGLPKQGLFLYPGAGLAGELWVAEIGIPPAAVADTDVRAQVGEPALIGAWLPRSAAEIHKGSRGRVLLVGGSRRMPGALALASLASLRVGAGIAFAAVPEPAGDLVAVRSPELITLRLPATEHGEFGPDAFAALAPEVAAAQVLAVGPGLGQGEAALALVRQVVQTAAKPLVLDADGVRAFAGHAEALRAAPAPVVLTPHPGELAALLGTTTQAIQADRPGALARAVAATGQVVLLKGAHTLVGAPDGRLWINITGNRALATAGSGDVLTGIIAGLIAQGMDPAEAAIAGACLHGHAADRLAARLGSDGLLASDLLAELPAARLELAGWGERYVWA